MLRRILSLKYAITVVVILAGAIYVSCQKQSARNQYEEECAQFNARTMAPAAHYEDCGNGTENAERHLPSWYRIFSWPDGITTWAILLTLIAIAEQTRETKRSADATKDAAQAANESSKALILSERAWLVIEPVSGMKLDEYDCFSILSWKITNVGKTPARLVETGAFCAKYTDWSDAFSTVPNYRWPRQLNKRMLAPNDFVTINAYSSECARLWDDSEEIKPGTRLYIVAHGYIRYLTSFGDECESRFCSDFSWKASQKSTIEFSSSLNPPSFAQSRYEYTLHT